MYHALVILGICRMLVHWITQANVDNFINKLYLLI